MQLDYLHYNWATFEQLTVPSLLFIIILSEIITVAFAEHGVPHALGFPSW